MTDRPEDPGQLSSLSPELRTGFSTGACAAAAASAAWLRFRGTDPGDGIDILFPDGKRRRIGLAGSKTTEHNGSAWVIKDAGDDVDITDKAVIRVSVRRIEGADVLEADHVEKCGKCDIVLRAGDGVGRVTRRGLDVPVGKWAINPVPRGMIIDNLKHLDIGSEDCSLLFEISIDNGAELAGKTLNPTLGIEGGLSILGTTGLVIPCSNKAYIATIKILLRGAAECGCKTAVLVTGGKTHRLARSEFPDLPEIAFVRIGDFIRESLESCGHNGFEKVMVVCMPGKLAKYAQGHAYTHAHTVAQSMDAVAEMLRGMQFPGQMIENCRGCRSVREFIESLPASDAASVLNRMADEAGNKLSEWAGKCSVEVIVFNTEV